MRAIVTKHNRRSKVLLKTMKNSIENMEYNEFPSLLNQIETMHIPDSCKEYVDKLNRKLANLIHTFDYREIMDNAAILKDLLESE